MSTDHADLALAAKAAGKHRCEWDHSWLAARGEALARDMLWDPRRDSGQALELAALLDIEIRFNTGQDEQTTTAVAPSPENPGSGEGWCFTTGWSWSGNKMAATRAAIFDAAVAIGRAMP